MAWNGFVTQWNVQQEQTVLCITDWFLTNSWILQQSAFCNSSLNTFSRPLVPLFPRSFVPHFARCCFIKCVLLAHVCRKGFSWAACFTLNSQSTRFPAGCSTSAHPPVLMRGLNCSVVPRYRGRWRWRLHHGRSGRWRWRPHHGRSGRESRFSSWDVGPRWDREWAKNGSW